MTRSKTSPTRWMGIRCPIRPLDDRVPRGGRASLRGRVHARIKPRKRYLRGRPDNRATTLAGVRRRGLGGHLSGDEPASIAEVRHPEVLSRSSARVPRHVPRHCARVPRGIIPGDFNENASKEAKSTRNRGVSAEQRSFKRGYGLR